MTEINLDTLMRAAGVEEQKVTKQDLVDLIVDELEDKLTAELKDLKEQADIFPAQYSSAYDLYVEQEKKDFLTKGAVQKLLEAFAELDVEVEVRAIEGRHETRGSSNPYVLLQWSPFAVGRCGDAAFWETRNWRGLSLRSLLSEVGPRPGEQVQLCFTVHATNQGAVVLGSTKGFVATPQGEALLQKGVEIRDRMDAIQLQLTKLEQGARKVKMALLREILGSTEQGSALLGALRARTTEGMLKKLKGG